MLDRIRDGRTDLVFPFLADGNAATSEDDRGVPLIRWCAYYGDVSAIRHLLAHGASLGDLGDDLDLNGAAFHGHWRLCEFLIEEGADPNRPLADSGETPLHAALCKAHRGEYGHVVRVLLAAGADPNAATTPGRETGCFMRDVRTRGETPLHRAAAYADPATIDLLLEAGAKLDARDAHGDTPLSWASWHLRPGTILAKLAHGDHRIGDAHGERMRSDHGMGWGNGMENNLLGRPRV